MFLKKKSLGQNFLRDKTVLSSMADAGQVTSKDTILEIGPGEGTLTEELLSRGARVIAIEKDDRLIPLLSEKFSSNIQSGQFVLVHDDALKFDISHEPSLSTNPYKIVANIPYYITGALIRKFLETEKQPLSMTVLVQREVAERAVSKNEKESILSLSIKIFGVPKKIRNVPPGAFSPQPSVDSAILTIQDIYPRIPKEKLPLYFEIVKFGFSSKRKKLSSNLKQIHPDIGSALSQTQLPENIRAEDVSFQSWLKLTELLVK